MRNPSSLKREFLKKWMMGLQIYYRSSTSSNKNMTVAQRKKAIKLSADIALASSRKYATRWSRAVIAGASVEYGSRVRPVKQSNWKTVKRIRWRRPRVKKCMKKAGAASTAGSIAKRLVQKRTKVLRRLVPGGEFMDEISLIEETLDYISALQAQVDVMRTLATAYHHQSSS